MACLDENDYGDFDLDTKFELYEQEDPASTHGSLKTYESRDGGLVYYQPRKSPHHICVERLLQVDGFEDSSLTKPLTLFLFKLVLVCTRDGRAIKKVKFWFDFDDVDELGTGHRANAQPLMWGPYFSRKLSNTTEVGLEDKVTFSTKVGAGGTGVGVDREQKTSRSTSCSASGRSWVTMGDSSQEPRGVTWSLESNPDGDGIGSVIRMAILLSRSSDEPYKAGFGIRVTAGMLHNWTNGIMEVLGLEPGLTAPYLVTPSKTPITRGEGQGLVGKFGIDPNNLGEWSDEGKLEELTYVKE